jgi:SAM-dependent methyltransferase
MRLRLTGTSLLERFALRLGFVPKPALEAWGGVALSSILSSAVSLGLFERLAMGAATRDDLVTALALDRDVTLMLLNCLVANGHIQRRGDRYRLSRSTRRWLDPDSPRAVSHFVAACADYASWWTTLPEAARSGRTIDHHAEPADSGYWDRYIAGQRDLARLCAHEVARRVPVAGSDVSMLDIGGGHGLYSAAILDRHPRLRSTIIDLPGSVRVGSRLAGGMDVIDRLTFREGDALTAALGEDHDIVLSFNLIHHLRPAEVAAFFARVRASLRPGGVLCVLDAFDEGERSPRAAQAAVSLFMFLSSGSKLYADVDIRNLLTGAGLDGIARVAIRRAPGLVLYTARRPR